MGTFTAAVAVLAAISMASERVIEILKKIFQKSLADAWQEENEHWRQALLQVLAGIIGGLIAWVSRDEIAAMIPSMAQFLHWPAYFLLGAMSSAGSGFWNHILDAVRAMKIEKEVKAQLQVQALNENSRVFKKSAIAA